MPKPPRIRLATALALTLCALLASFDAAAVVGWNKVFTGVSSPIDIVSPRDGTNRLFLVQQTGTVRIVENGTILPTPFIDLSSVILSGGEQGLLGLAFHPQYGTNRRFFVNYTRKSDGATVVARYTATAGTPNVADPASATILLTIPQPYSNHHGGSVKFGADGFLYIGMGDGGSGNDPEMRAQDKTTLLGKILRIDVSNGNPYAIPPGNPFASGVGGLPEIFAIGLRNPWRISFDRTTGDFWIGDVGQGAVEEIDLLPVGTGAGANLGWRVVEGNQCTGLSGPVACSDPTLTAPVLTYTHAFGCSVTGGFVYRGAAVPALAGQYLYADFCSGIIWAAQKNGAGQWIPAQLGDTTFGITTFGEDEAGELYFADYNAGDIYKFIDTTPTAPVLGLTSTSLGFGNVVVGATSAAQTITVSNAGGGTLTLTALSGGTGTGRTAEFLRTGTCANATSLTGAQTCTIVYQFKPAQTGVRSATLAVSSNGGNANVALAGTGVTAGQTPVLTPSTTALTFGSVNIGSSSATQTITLTNTGGGTLTLTSLSAGGANPGDFTRTGTCANGTNLAAAQSCTVIYQFTPTMAGVRAASLAVVSNGGNTTLTASGTGVVVGTAPVLTPSGTVLSFGNVDLGSSSATQSIMLTNTGGGTLTLATLTAGGANIGDFTRTGTCANGTSLTAAQSCTVIYQFTPATTGARSATLAVASNGGSTTINVNGTGIVAGGPVLNTSATTLGFGSIFVGGASATQTVTVSNAGSGTLTLASLTAGGANPTEFPRTGTCANGTALAAAQSCTVIYRFTPFGVGSRSASLALASNGGNATISVSGTGVSPR
ncbi:MAG: choice-of-anchor D domain-containing protein [Casimicrobiaceae bacterium]